jgi:DNA-directed RNA polymerase II subunit RPB1
MTLRSLTNEEIENIVSGLRFAVKHTKVQEHLLEIHKSKTRTKLKQIKVKETKIQELKMGIINNFYASICSPYESIGVNASQCIGEPTTQGTLNTFHSSGISAKNTTLGFARARELFNATHTPTNPTCNIYFTKDNKTLENLHKVSDKIPATTIGNLVKDYKVFDPSSYVADCEDNPLKWQQVWFKLHPDEEPINEDEWCLRLKFNVTKLYNYNLKISEIAKKICNNFSDVRCIQSPLNIGIIDVIVDCSQVNITNNQTTTLEDIEDDDQAREFYMSKIVSPRIRGEYICGVSGISKLYYRKVKSNESFGGFPLKKEIADRLKTDEEWIIDTDGTNLSELLAQPGVDYTRTISNDMWEILSIFGIEAARQYMFVEFMNIITSGGSSINPIHILTLVSKMTYTGSIRAIARFGVETSQYDPIARATFEEVMTQLITSTVFSETDKLKGISSNIVLGTKISAGTGMVEFEDIQLNIVKSPIGSQVTPPESKIKPPKQTIVDEEFEEI